jgi:hypothetical protein
MKKNVLALSMSAAILSFGFAGAAYAITDATPTGGTGTQLAANLNGIGHMLLVPYFTSQDKNHTLLNMVNTDTTNGKIVKVRFRGAANSDDLFDFLVFMSPGDVWSGDVSQNSAGLSTLATGDNSCSKPAKSVITATPFKTTRLDQSLSAELKAGGTREGYVEMFVVADVPPTGGLDAIKTDGTAGTNGLNDLYDVIKHNSSGVALCTGTIWSYFDANRSIAEYISRGATYPTTGLTASWTVINVDGAAAWGANARAIQAVNDLGAPQQGNMVYWPQVGTAVGATIGNYTSDPLFQASLGEDSTGGTFNAAGAVTATWVDLPDMSTPYIGNVNPGVQAAQLSNSIAATDVMNEFITSASIQGTTDWVFAMPTRRYSVALDYASVGKTISLTATDTGKRFALDALTFNGAAARLYQLWFRPDNTSVQTLNGYKQICVSGISSVPYNREEASKTNPADVVVSPAEVTPGISFCGEASVLSFNAGGTVPTPTLKAVVAAKDVDASYGEGWMHIATPNAVTTYGTLGFPILGASFTRALAGTAHFGGNWDHRFRAAPSAPAVQ